MSESAVTDAGPVIHLSEARAITAFRIFRHVAVSERVRAEILRHRGWDALAATLRERLSVTAIDAAELLAARGTYGAFTVSDADVSVAALAARVSPDDLALRGGLEAHGFTVVGSVGILVRAYALGRLSRPQLDEAIERLLDGSTLYLSRSFRVVIQRLLAELPPS